MTLALGLTASPAAAGDGDDDGPGTTQVVEDPGIIPRPNSGHEPEDAGDRGGALQIALFFAIVAGMSTIGLLAYRDSRRARAKPVL